MNDHYWTRHTWGMWARCKNDIDVPFPTNRVFVKYPIKKKSSKGSLDIHQKCVFWGRNDGFRRSYAVVTHSRSALDISPIFPIDSYMSSSKCARNQCIECAAFRVSLQTIYSQGKTGSHLPEDYSNSFRPPFKSCPKHE